MQYSLGKHYSLILFRFFFEFLRIAFVVVIAFITIIIYYLLLFYKRFVVVAVVVVVNYTSRKFSNKLNAN